MPISVAAGHRRVVAHKRPLSFATSRGRRRRRGWLIRRFLGALVAWLSPRL
jgi:hypothetical protein